MLRRNIAAPSKKILWKTLISVKFYDKSNLNVFTLSQWENFRWGLIYFDQFIRLEPVHEISNDLVCATNKGSDQPAHMRSLIRAFASRLSIL